LPALQCCDTGTETALNNEAVEAFERLWARLDRQKARLRSLNEKDKAELKEVMRMVFLAAVGSAAQKTPQEVSISVQQDPNALREMLAEVLEEKLSGLAVPATASPVSGDAGVPNIKEALASEVFSSEMTTNIDEVELRGDKTAGVARNKELLRKLRGGKNDA